MEPLRVTDAALLERINQQKRILPQISQEIHDPNDEYRKSHLELTTKEAQQKGYQNKLWARLGHTTVLADEIENQYGSNAPRVAHRNYAGSRIGGGQQPIIDTILTSRRQQHSDKLDENALEISQLVQKRQQLQDEKDKVKLQKKGITIPHAPVASSLLVRPSSEPLSLEKDDDLPSFVSHSSSQSVMSFIKSTNNRLPGQIERYRQHRSEFTKQYLQLYKPYDGHLGPQSYEAWQMEDYYMVRGIVEEIVDVFLDQYFWSVPPLRVTEMPNAVLTTEMKNWEQQRKVIIQASAIQLIMEEMMLKITRQMAEEAAQEFFDMYKFIYTRSNGMFAKTTQAVTKGKAPDNPNRHKQVISMMENVQENRTKYRLSLYSHSQPLTSKGKLQSTNAEQ